MSVWITVPEAAQLAHRGQWTIYDWIRKGRLRTRHDAAGRMLVDGAQLLEVEPTVKRGRPAGSASLPW